MRAYWYIRVSGKGQVDGDGPDRQREAIKVFCEQHGLVFAGEFFEAGVSGTKEGMDRPQFAEMIETVDARNQQGLTPIRVIVVERMDRLARDLMVSEMLLRECRTRGIKVYSVDQGQLIDMATDAGDPTRKLIRQILGALAEWEKSALVKKLHSARQRVKAQTGRCEGIKPYGTFPGEIHTLRVMKTLRASHLTFDRIAIMLNEQGLYTRSKKPWTRAAVFSVLKNNQQKEKTCAEHTHNS